MESKTWQFTIVSVIGIAIVLVFIIFIFAMLINYKRWAEQRDKHYSDKHNSLEKKVDGIEGSNTKIIEKASEVIEAANAVIKKKR